MARKLPDPDICEARETILFRIFGECLVKKPAECPCVMRHNGTMVCRNPKWREFVREGVGSGGG